MARRPLSTGKWPWAALAITGPVPSTGLQSDISCPVSEPLLLKIDRHRDIGGRSIPIEPAARSRPHLSRLPALALLRRPPIVCVVTASPPASVALLHGLDVETTARWLVVLETLSRNLPPEVTGIKYGHPRRIA